MSCFCCGSADDVVIGNGGDGEQATIAGEQFSDEQSTGVLESARKCYQLSKETVELCQTTVLKGQRLVEFGADIRDTLASVSKDMNADALSTIKELITGSKVQEAKSLAMDMDSMALECVQKSMDMVTALEEGVDALPDWIERYVEKKAEEMAQDQSPEQRELLENVTKDQEELENCIEAITDLKLMTAMDAGKRAFDGITSKSEVCRVMFESIKQFSLTLVETTEAFMSLDLNQIVLKAKDILKCIGLSKLIQEFAKQCGNLIKKVVDLFSQASDKLGELWSALAYAKDCLEDCVEDVKESLSLCSDAKERGQDLKERSRQIMETLSSFGDDDSLSSLRASALGIKNLIQKDDIGAAIELAKTMDDIVLESAKKTRHMVDKVTEGYRNLPPILTVDLSDDMEEEGADDDDPSASEVELDVEGSIESLKRSQAEVEDSDWVLTVQSSIKALCNADENIDKTRAMLETTKDFAARSKDVMDLFLGSWNLEVATSKLKDMCRLVRLGELTRKFAQQIQRLLQAIVTLFNTIVEKCKRLKDKLDLDDIVPDALDNVMDAAASAMTDKFSSLLGCGKIGQE
jgi:phage host-nuclease inhibitor protein Gam